MDREDELFFEMLNTTFNAAELAGVRVQDAFPALVDFVVALSIAMIGEEELYEDSPIMTCEPIRVGRWRLCARAGR